MSAAVIVAVASVAAVTAGAGAGTSGGGDATPFAQALRREVAQGSSEPATTPEDPGARDAQQVTSDAAAAPADLSSLLPGWLPMTPPTSSAPALAALGAPLSSAYGVPTGDAVAASAADATAPDALSNTVRDAQADRAGREWLPSGVRADAARLALERVAARRGDRASEDSHDRAPERPDAPATDPATTAAERTQLALAGAGAMAAARGGSEPASAAPSATAALQLPADAVAATAPVLAATPTVTLATMPPPAADALPSTRHIAAAPDSVAFAPALANQVSVLIGDGVQQARLSLNPAELGPVSVRIVLDGVEARIDFTADLPATRAALEASLPTLAAVLDEGGLRLAGGGVHDGQAQPRDRHASDGAPTARRAEAAAAPTSDTFDAGAPASSRAGLVNLIA
jgi:flagellar hook-length control protein FliK